MSRYGVYGKINEIRVYSSGELGGTSKGPALRCGVCNRSRCEWRLSGECECPDEVASGAERGVVEGV